MATKDPITPSNEAPSLQFTSGGYTLYTPPTPFSVPPEPARFVLLDDLNNTFYSIDYSSPHLLNTVPWTALALHTIPDPAIVFPPNQWSIFLTQNPNTCPVGFLVSIKSRAKDNGVIEAVKIGAVGVQVIARELMNWGVLESLKGEELPKEMRNGLLRKVFDRRPRSGEGEGGRGRGRGFVTPGAVVDGMPRQWHLSGEALNWELDQRFVGGLRIKAEQRWKLFAE